MIQTYWYEGQLRSYMLQFCAIFNGLQVQTGIGECGDPEFIPVPIVIGNKDRVVAAIMAGNTQNRVFALPALAAHLTSIDLAPDRRKVQAYVDQRVTLPVGGVFPTDLTVVKRAMPTPYNITIELSMYVSNTLQRDQILEQLLVLFNPDLQIQKSDGPFDWAKLTKVELTGISNEENYPISTDRRIIQWTLTFEMPIFISMPMGVKNDLVRRIIVQIGDLDSFSVNEVDALGELQPFGEPFARIDFDSRPVPAPADCTYVQTNEPTNPEVDETWHNPVTLITKRWNSIQWAVMEQYVPPTAGPTPPEVDPLP